MFGNNLFFNERPSPMLKGSETKRPIKEVGVLRESNAQG